MAMIRLHSYSGTQNLGDAIQSLGLLRLCKELRPDLEYGWVDRDNNLDRDELQLGNGWLGERWTPSNNAILCGVHLAHHLAHHRALMMADTGATHPNVQSPIGSRDPYTHELLTSRLSLSEMIGCATLTLPRYSGQRNNNAYVDSSPCDRESGTTWRTHTISQHMEWDRQKGLAQLFLQKYQNSKSVYTSRLHVLLPCIAFGTPVALTHIPPNEERRFSLAKYLGVEVGNEPKVYDASELAAKFRAFTLDALNRLSPP